jgi:hypothetical protein
MATSCHHLFCCYTSTEEYDGTLPLSSSSQTQRRQNTKKKPTKKTNKREGAYLQAPALPFHFWLPLLPSRFCTSISSVLLAYFSSQTKEKKNTHRKKKHKEKKNA